MDTPQQIAADIAQELRANPHAWTQHTYARTASGADTDAHALNAVCWCLRGHLKKRLLYGEEVKFLEFFDRVLGGAHSPSAAVTWNDEPERTVEDVIALCDRVANGVQP